MIQFREVPRCYSAVNRIINRTNEQNARRYEMGKTIVKLTSKRLQKILYLCQLFWFIEKDESNMIPEDFQAWPHGPVISEIYDYWAVYHDGYISQCPYVRYKLSKEETDLINQIVDNTIDMSTWEIIDYTQLPDGPWAQAYQDYQGVRSVISKDSMKQYIRKDETQRELRNFILNNETREASVKAKKLIL